MFFCNHFLSFVLTLIIPFDIPFFEPRTSVQLNNNIKPHRGNIDFLNFFIALGLAYWRLDAASL